MPPPPTFAKSDLGQWNLNGTYANVNPINTPMVNYQTALAGYSVVTPEPAAMALYAIGGLPLAAAFFRRRKNTTNV